MNGDVKNILYLPVYKSTSYNLKNAPKIRPRLIENQALAK